MIFEEILHLLPTLKKLRLTFIGIEVPNVSKSKDDVGPIELECCPVCTASGRIRSLQCWKGEYHEYFKEPDYKAPDLAVAFHSGFSQLEQSSWIPTFKHLATASHPTLFTTYNITEMREDVSLLESFGAQYLRPGEVNKWKGAPPILEAMEEEENAVYYVNHFWYIVAAKHIS